MTARLVSPTHSSAQGLCPSSPARPCHKAATGQVASVALLILTLQAWQVHGAGRLTTLVFALSVAASLYSCGRTLHDPQESPSLGGTALHLLLNGAGAVLILANAGLVWSHLIQRPYGDVVALSLFIGLPLMCLAQVLQMGVQLRTHFSETGNLPKHMQKRSLAPTLVSGVIALGLVVVGLHFLGHWFRWDSSAYYVAMQRIDIANLFDPLREGLMLAGHPAGAYAISVLLARCIPGISLLDAMYVTNVFTLVVTWALLTALLKSIVVKLPPVLYPFLGLALTCSTYLFGSVDQLNPEHLCMMGLLLFIVGLSRKNRAACLVACYIACNTRETAIPLIALFILIQLIFDVRDGKGLRGKLDAPTWAYYLSCALIGLSWLLIYTSVNWGAGMAAASGYLYEDGTPLFGIALSLPYLLNQLKGIFLTNFTWLFALALVAAGIIFFVRNGRRGILILLSQRELLVVLVGAIAATGIMCLYLTHHNFRYYTQAVVFLQIAGCAALIYLASLLTASAVTKALPALASGVLLLGQCFTTLDPVMLSAFSSLSTGTGRIVTMPWNISGYPNDQFLECAHYNFQIAFFDEALDLAYSKLDLSNSKVLLYDGYRWGNKGNTFNSIWGMGYYAYDLYTSWNEDAQHRELRGSEDENLDPLAVSNIEGIDALASQYSHMYYLELPWGDQLADDLDTSAAYSTRLVDTIEHGGWVIKIHELTARTGSAES